MRVHCEEVLADLLSTLDVVVDFAVVRDPSAGFVEPAVPLQLVHQPKRPPQRGQRTTGKVTDSGNATHA